MTASSCSTITSRRYRTRRMVVFGLILLTLLDTVSGMPYKRSLQRLCSKSLSDALQLACKDRGYNEPFSYSGEDEPQDHMGPGLVEECCNQQCTYIQLQQYCKPDKSSSAEAVKKPMGIVSTSYSAVRLGTSSEERSRSDTDYVVSMKCRIHGLKGSRKKGTNLNHDDVIVGCDGKSTVKRHRGGHCGCRHQRLRRRRLGKVLEKELVDTSSKSEALKDLVSARKRLPFPFETDFHSNEKRQQDEDGK